MAKEYVAPAQSAVNFGDVSNQLSATGVKNIVAVTACPTGVAHTFLSAEAIETYAKNRDGILRWKPAVKWERAIRLRRKK